MQGRNIIPNEHLKFAYKMIKMSNVHVNMALRLVLLFCIFVASTNS